MAFVPKVNEAGVFENRARPDLSDMNGQIQIECSCGRVTDYWLSAWRKVTKDGARYMSISLKPKKMGEHGVKGVAPGAPVDDGDDIPQW
jgi:hypothetical protein